jgi:hypothetical protein
MNDKPLWSRCSLGRSRWYWVVYRSYSDLFDQADPIATGYSDSPEGCEAGALAIEPTATCYRTHLAAGHHRKLCIEKRKRKPSSNSKKTVQQEYVYTDHDAGWDYGASEWHSQSHRIIKVTRNSVFVDKERWYSSGGHDVECYRLDRAELMATGEVWSRQARERFYTTPIEQRRQQFRPQYLVDLDLPHDANEAQIKSQFRRLARVHHPDCGGDAEEFKRIKAAYEQATSAVR